MSDIYEQGNSEKTSINFGISIWSPSSAIYGSPTLFYFQPILYGNIFASTVVLSVAQLFLFLLKYFFGLEKINILCPGSDNEDQIISDDNTIQNNSVSQISPTFSDLTFQGFVTSVTPEIPLIIGLSVSADYSNQTFSPSIFITMPVFTLNGIRGTLPLLILELLATIFVRAVVPPELTGVKPLKQKLRNTRLFNENRENMADLLNRLGQYFTPQRK